MIGRNLLLATLLLGVAGCFALPARALDSLNYEDYPSLRLRALDKVTARTVTFDATIGSTLKFADIYIKVLACRKPPPVEKQEAAAFLQIWEVDTTQNKSRWIFSGWTFASSPALSGMEHPVYDVWLIDCLGKDPEELPPEMPAQNTLQGEGAVPENSVSQPELTPDTSKEAPQTTPEPAPEPATEPNPEPTPEPAKDNFNGIY